MTGLTGPSYRPGVADSRGAYRGFNVREGPVTRTLEHRATR